MSEEARNEVVPPPAHVHELAEACRRYVVSATGMELDYGSETLPVLDHYLRSVERKPDVQALVAAAAGAYFGEVVRAQLPCRWHAPEEDYGAWRIEFEPVFLHFNPVALAHEAVLGAEVVEGGAGFGVLDQDLDTVRGGLEALGTIAEDDYFKLTTRHEVLVTVFERLLAGHTRPGEPQLRFDAAAYRVALDLPGEGFSSTQELLS